MRSTLATCSRGLLALILSGQIVVGQTPWILGGGLGGPAVAHAADDDAPAPMPNGATPTEATKRDSAAGFDYGVNTNSGSFSTTIPIETPPGRLGVEPKLALAYSSSSGTPGLAGVGWELALPAVRMDPQISFMAAARYQLDGNRLIEDAAAPGTFATEHDTYARIRRTCAGASDCTFVVDDRGGLRLRFGTTADSRLVGRWGLDRIEDAHGNYLTISYMTDADFAAAFGTGHARSGALVPKEIRYTGSATRAPWYAVRFEYEKRPANDDYLFQSGWASERLRYRLRTIRTVGGDNATIRSYALTYTQAANGRSLLAGVAVSGFNGATGPKPFAMTYAGAGTGFTPAQAVAAPPLDSRVVVGDFNGDGRNDLLTYRRTNDAGVATHAWQVQPGTATGLGAASTWLSLHPYNFPGACADAKDGVYAGDWDADGDTDLFHYAKGCGSAPRWRVLVSRGDRLEVRDWVPAAQTGVGSAFDTTDANVVFADVTGDGRADAVLMRAALGTVVESREAAPTFVSYATGFGTAGVAIGAGDMNGDRMTDIVVRGTNGLMTTCAQGGGGFSPCGSVSFPTGSTLTTGDFNGDGLTDLLVGGTSSSTLWTSLRLGYASQAVPLSGIGVRAADVDGDGRDDLLKALDTTGNGAWALRTWLMRGATFVAGATAGYPDLALGTVPVCLYNPELLAADLTGDGRADPIVRLRSAAGASCQNRQFATAATDAPAVDRLASILTPTGLTLQASYQRSSSAGLPIALPVVAELRIRDFPRLVLNRMQSPTIETHRYLFAGGGWDAARGELTGFASATDETVERNLTETIGYRQDAPARGKIARRAQARTSPYELLASDQYRYRDDPTAPYRTEVEWHLRMYWAAGKITARTLQGYQYDGAGNLARFDDHGLCSATGDDRHTETTYRSATDFNLRRPAEVYLFEGAAAPPSDLASFSGCTGSASRLVEGTRHEYDDTSGSIIRGDLTRRHRLLIGAGGALSWLRTHDHGYRPDGLLTSTTDARGFVSSVLAYDPVLDLYPARVRNGAGVEEAREYEPHFGKLSRTTDANGSARSFYYDAFGRPVGVRTPLASGLWMNTVTWAYGDGFPNWTATLAPFDTAAGMQGGASVAFRDALGRRIAEVRDGDSMEERVIAGRAAYWAATSQPVAIAPPAEVAVASCGTIMSCLASWASFQPAQVDWRSLTTAPGTPAQLAYDPLGRAVRRDNPDGSFVTYTHSVDELGFGLVELDEVGDQRRLYRDARGDLSRVERWASPSAPPAITSYGHDARRKLTSITSPLGVKTKLAWGSLGRLDRVDSLEVGTLTYGYDDDGHEITRTDARGVTTTTAVDALGRPTYRASSTGDVALWAYDRAPMCAFWCTSPPPNADNTMGRPWAVFDGSGYTTFAYDADGHLARETRSVSGVPYTTSFVNWPTGVVVRKTYPDGETHRFTMAPDGQPAALLVGADPVPAVAMTRDGLGRPSTVRYASGASMRHTVDPLTQRLDAIDTLAPSGTVVQHIDYTYRPDGTVESMSHADALGDPEEAYVTHDGSKRVTDVFVAPDVTDPAEHYAYDADGRMQVRKDRDRAPVTMAYTDPQHPHAVTAIGARTLAYDAGGNRIEDRTGASTTAMTYDGAGRMTTVGATVSYGYDADGQRVIERGPAGTRLVLGGYTVEPDGSTRKTLQLGATRLGERSSVAGNRFVHTDAIGSVVGETTAAGVLDTTRGFSAFGIPVSGTTVDASSRLGFGGYPVDADTGLSYASARYYDPTTASFTQPDSWLYGFDNPEALNAYAYAANSPYQYADPSGHVIVPILIAAGITFVIGMGIDIAIAEGHPDWGYIIIKNLTLAAIAAGTAGGATAWALATPPGTFYLFPFLGIPNEVATLMAAGMIGGGVSGVVAQEFQDSETGEYHDTARSFGSGAVFGGLAGLLGLGSGNLTAFQSVFAASIMLEARAVAAVNPPESRNGYRIRYDAPAGAAIPPPTCGRGDSAQTLPGACDALAW